MEVDMNAWRIDHEGEGVATPELSSNGRPKVSRDASMFQPLLEDVMEKCKALNDYATANLIFEDFCSNRRTLNLHQSGHKYKTKEICGGFSRIFVLKKMHITRCTHIWACTFY